MDDQADRYLYEQRAAFIVRPNEPTPIPDQPAMPTNATINNERRIALFHRMVASIPHNIANNPHLRNTTYAYITDLIDSYPAIHYGSYMRISAQFRQELRTIVAANDHPDTAPPPQERQHQDSDSDSSPPPLVPQSSDDEDSDAHAEDDDDESSNGPSNDNDSDTNSSMPPLIPDSDSEDYDDEQFQLTDAATAPVVQ
jgi:hypothetical protein